MPPGMALPLAPAPGGDQLEVKTPATKRGAGLDEKTKSFPGFVDLSCGKTQLERGGAWWNAWLPRLGERAEVNEIWDVVHARRVDRRVGDGKVVHPSRRRDEVMVGVAQQASLVAMGALNSRVEHTTCLRALLTRRREFCATLKEVTTTGQWPEVVQGTDNGCTGL